MPETYSELARRLWPYLRPLLADVLATAAQGLKLTNSTPASIVPGNGRVGTSTAAARADHRHPWNGNATSLGGVAASAYALKSDLLGVGNTGARLDPNLVLATPATTKGTTSLRALVLADLPDIDLDDLADADTTGVTSGDVLRYDGSLWEPDTLELDDLENVDTTGVAPGDMLRYDGSTWEPDTLGLGDLDNVNTVSIASGDVLRYDGSLWEPDTLELDDLENVTTTSAAVGDGLVFDGTDWEITPLADRNLLHNATVGVQTGLYSAGATVGPFHTHPYPVARWRVVPTGGDVTVNEETGTLPVGVLTHAGLRITGGTGVTEVKLAQRHGAIDVKNLFRRTLSISWYVYNDTGAAVTPDLVVRTPSASDDWSTSTARLTQSLQSCADAAWTRVSHTFDPSAYTNIGNGIELALVFSGTLNSGTEDVIITAAQLEPGNVITPFQARDLGLETLIIQRYLVSLPQSGGGTGYVGNGTGISTTAARIGIPLPQTMRAAPSVLVRTAVSDFQLTDGVSSTTLTAIAIISASALYCVLGPQVASGLTQYRPYFLQQANGSARLFFIAEY